MVHLRATSARREALVRPPGGRNGAWTAFVFFLMRTIPAISVLAVCACSSGSLLDRSNPRPLAPPSGPAPVVGECPVFPAGNEWNRDISGDPIDSRSGA